MKFVEIFSSISHWFWGEYGVIVLLSIPALFLITFFKRRSQLGKTWEGPVTAKVRIAGEQLVCQHCQCQRFTKREGLISTSFVMYLRLGFWNRSARCFVCSRCGFVHWFISRGEEVEICHDVPVSTIDNLEQREAL